MTTNSTPYKMVESALENQGTSLTILLPDLLDEGQSFDDITLALHERTGVPISSRTVRRWAKRVRKAAA
jgi:hypothetical protein